MQHFCTIPRMDSEGIMPRKAAPWVRKATGEWYVTHHGTQTPLGVHGKENELQAWAAFQKLLENAANQKPSVRSEPLAALVPGYLASLESRAVPKTIRDYGATLKTFLARFGNSAALEIDPHTVELHASRQGWSDSYRNNWLWTVQALIRWAGRKDFTMRRPAKESRGADSLISEDTYRLILRETRGDFHELCRFLWCVGCRPMEAARLEAGMIDWTSGTVTLKKHKTKHKGRQRILYLSAEALMIVKAQSDRYDGTGHLFRGVAGKPFTIQAVVSRMIRLSEKIGRSVCAYDFRHTWATRALEAGVPDTHVSAMLGHTSTSMLHLHYSHLGQNAKLLRDMAERVSRKDEKAA
jgi:integrase